METWTVYILCCRDHTYYTGCTSNFEERFKRHQEGNIHYTRSRLPLKLTTSVIFRDKYKTYAFEKYLKSGFGIAFRNRRLIQTHHRVTMGTPKVA
jgi:putative endonuclease